MKKVLNVIFCGLLGLFVSCEGLVFVREDNGIKHVYKMRYNGSSQMPFSPITGTTYDYPDISPDGTKIAYTDGQNVFLSDLNDMGGSSQQQLSTPSGIKTHVRWAPQQQVIGYANTVSGTASIFLSATNGVNFLWGSLFHALQWHATASSNNKHSRIIDFRNIAGCLSRWSTSGLSRVGKDATIRNV